MKSAENSDRCILCGFHYCMNSFLSFTICNEQENLFIVKFLSEQVSRDIPSTSHPLL